ncbi:hypothetical protein OQA88_9369 [Cercophora sp. LCS_1]
MGELQQRRASNSSPTMPPSRVDMETHASPSSELHYPTPLGLGLITIGLCFAVFLFALVSPGPALSSPRTALVLTPKQDQTIVANAVPKITDEFGSVSDIGWYGSAFLLCTAAFQLFYGSAYSYFSIKIVFLAAVGIFELGSLVCALAPTSTALIIGRAVAGLGGSGLMPGALIIIAHSVPLRVRPIFMGAMGGMFGIASVCGPLLGGVFTDRLTWRWCFYINLPFGAVTALVIAFFFKSPRRPAVDNLPFLTKAKQIDWISLALFVPFIVCLLLALQWGGSTYPWNDGRIIALFVVSGALGIAFGVLQYLRSDKAIVPPRIITQRSVAAAAWYAFFNGAALFILIYYTPLWHQVIRQVSAVNSGIRLLPLIVGMVVMIMISGVLVTVFGYYAPLMLLASILAPIGEGLMSTWTVDASFSQWFGYEALTGLAVGMGMQQPMIAVQTVLPIDDVPIATSLMAFMQSLGAAVFVAVAQAIFENRLIANLEKLLPAGAGLDPENLIQAGATKILAQVPPQLQPSVREALNHAITRVYVVSICASSLTLVGSLAMEWRSVKKTQKVEAAVASTGAGNEEHRKEEQP